MEGNSFWNCFFNWYHRLLENHSDAIITISLVASLVTVFLVIRDACKRRKDNENISIAVQLNKSNDYHTLPHTVKRKSLTRAEVQGILGTMHGGGRYDIPYLKNEQYSEQIKEIQDGKSNKLVIYIDNPNTFKRILGHEIPPPAKPEKKRALRESIYVSDNEMVYERITLYPAEQPNKDKK